MLSPDSQETPKNAETQKNAGPSFCLLLVCSSTTYSVSVILPPSAPISHILPAVLPLPFPLCLCFFLPRLTLWTAIVPSAPVADRRIVDDLGDS